MTLAFSFMRNYFSAEMGSYHSLLSAIKACAPDDDEQHLVWRRRAYVWRKLGKVLPDGPESTRGSGAGKRYAAATIPLIGVLLRLADKYPSTEGLDAVSRALERNIRTNPAFSRKWDAALAQAEEWDKQTRESVRKWFNESTSQGLTGPVPKATAPVKEDQTYLTIAFPTPVRDDFAVRCGNTPIFTEDDIDIYVLDLDYVFLCMFHNEDFRLT